MAEASDYYIPHGTKWPIIASVGVTTLLVGAASWMNGSDNATMVMLAGLAIIIYMMFGWFGEQIDDSMGGKLSKQVDLSYRWGMSWFIFSEVMFFAAFFGALFYARVLSVPWLMGEGAGVSTHVELWAAFTEGWPTNGPGDVGGAFSTIGAWGIPALNTAILLLSGVTITWAHHGLKHNNRNALILGLAATVALGCVFLYYQAYEYMHAYGDLNLTLGSGIYGSTFFMLTGFHGMHVTIGTIMLIVMLLRSMKGHFTPEQHFAFEATAWYWHFVDVVWLGLFIFVYVI